MTVHVTGEDYPARWWHAGGDGLLHCEACPRACALAEGERGACHVRQRRGNRIILTTYGRAVGFCLDPIEKKPLYHFHPGTAVLSLGTAGCNLQCRSCRTWRPEVTEGVDASVVDASPLAIADAAAEWQCRSVAFTYNDPVVYAEYAIDIARTCHVRGVQTIAVTGGYVSPQVRRELFGVMDAANIDLKAFDQEKHLRFTGGNLQPVLDTLLHVRHRSATWLEISTLLVPGINDDQPQLRAMSTWIREELGPEVPLHFATPRYAGRPPTPAAGAAMARARNIAREAGLLHVYTGPGGDKEGSTTYCPGCGTALVEREGITVGRYRLTAQGRCPECRTTVAGAFDDRPGEFGARRIPVRLE
jgi:pyruvate formate lyase activating enzyme